MYHLAGDVDGWRGCASQAQGVCGKFLYLPLNFTVNRKLLKKIKYILKIHIW